MNKLTIETFFAGKNLVVPGYQRDYAWREKNINELMADVEEAQVAGSHYLGTFILSQKEPSDPIYVVDGQQRLTTLTMLLDALIDAIDDEEFRNFYRSTYIRHPVDGLKFQVLGVNKTFFESMLAKQEPPEVPESAGQKRLAAAYEHIRLIVAAVRQQGGQESILQMLKAITKMEVLEFIEADEGKAIRMFQTVNDRGVPLAKMDIVKSLLVLYSNRYLNGILDQSISEQFGKAFRAFSNVKALAAELGYQIKHVDRDSFREDDLLRYHYFAFDASSFGVEAGNDYNATSESVLETFLKPALNSLRSTPDDLQKFIEIYTSDLTAFFEGLEALIKQTRTDRSTFMLLVVQNLSATLYPLVIRLHLMGWLPRISQFRDTRSLHELIELVDLRVFKLRGTNPQADVFWITRGLPKTTLEQVVADLQSFCQKFMPDALMASRVVDEGLYKNECVHRMLWSEEDQVRSSLNMQPVGIIGMATLYATGLTVEHILPQKPSFSVIGYGFKSEEQYEQYMHRIGNLILLEGGINSACQNKAVEQKVSHPNLYLRSDLKVVKSLAAQRNGASQGFRRENIETRGGTLSDLLLQQWPIVSHVSNVGSSISEDFCD